MSDDKITVCFTMTMDEGDEMYTAMKQCYEQAIEQAAYTTDPAVIHALAGKARRLASIIDAMDRAVDGMIEGDVGATH